MNLPGGGGAPAADLDEFRLIRVLGEGGMGTVYLGHDTVLDRPVAIKIVRAGVVDEAARGRILTEARAIARLHHPNVVTVYRAGVTRTGQPYLAQELIQGESLAARPRPVAVHIALRLGIGIARGLAAAHRAGILHRDIKPANVMVADGDHPKLLDFGIATVARDAPAPAALPAARRTATAAPPVDETAPLPGEASPPGPTAAVTASSGAPDVTAPGPAASAADGLIGTPRYAAPELWRGEPASVRSDLWSLGVVLHELVTGAPPFPQAELAALRAAITGDAPPPRIDAPGAPDVPAELAALVAECLARDPAGRPASADDVVHRLERIADGTPSLPDGNPYPGLAPFEASHRAVFFGRGADVAAVVDRLRASPAVAVIGDSGTGKSSVCRAGVIPAVVRGALGDRRRWSVVTAPVGRRPATALRDALGLTDELPGSVAELAARLGGGAGTGVGTLVFVDQLEELVTVAEPGEAAAAAKLLAALAGDAPGLRVLVTVRGDFVTRVADLPALGPVLMRSLHLLRRLDRGDLREAIVGPARARGVGFGSDAMVDALVDAVATSPGALPLLQFTLAALWQQRDEACAVIPEAALDALGGVGGSLARHGDGILTALAAAERTSARRILVSLVTRDGTRASRERAELVAPDDAPAAAALEALVRGRLVVAQDTPRGAPTYTLSHDALVASWGTLRDWLDAESALRGVRARVATASDEWHRLGRPRELLWSAAQLGEAAALTDVAGRDRAFLDASRRAVRRRRARNAVLAISLPAVAVATWSAVRAADRSARDREVGARLAVARDQLAAVDDARGRAEVERAAAFAAFDRGDLADGEARWARARDALREARAAARGATTALEAALVRGGQRADVRARMADAIYAHALLAELDDDPVATGELLERLAAYDDGSRAAAWRAPATLVIDAAGARRIEVRPYLEDDGVLVPGAPVATSTGASLTAALAPGSYVAQIDGAAGVAVAAPVRLDRGERLELAAPVPATIPAGFVHVPAGRFVVGGAGDAFFRRDFLTAPPRHVVETAAYRIARHEVTFGEWIEYLRALPPDERERRRPLAPPGRVMTMRLEGERPYTLVLQPSTVPYRAAEGEPLVYPGRSHRRSVRWERLPVTGVSFDDALAYAAWLAETGRVPGARLCSEWEWERAARGADGRSYPHGERLDPDDANIDVTYGREPLGYGPDEVGSHPRSRSPFGVDDLTGNVWEWVRGADGAAILRGGGWYHGAVSALTMNRDANEPTMRPVWAGIRLCADP